MQITKDDDRGGAVLNCAVRYALGRSSYMQRQFLFFHDGMFCTTINDDVCGCFGNYMSWEYARLPMEGE